MSREIKFRAWAGSKMVYDVYKEYDCLMQYTGLNDKNGKEIYEGDIVKTQDGFSIGAVTYSAPSWGLQYSIAWCNDWEWEQWEKEFEVIGNIYENLELLEGELNE